VQTALAAGQQVEVRGELWVVVGSEIFDDCTLVTLRGSGEDNHGLTTRLLTPFDRPRALGATDRPRGANRQHVLRTAARAVARTHRWLDSWTAARARIDLLPWQLEPVMAVIRGATRVLLADEVGLGKTIQAGLILAELRARGLVARALILTPASLREQWAAELRDRFALDAQVVDHATLTSVLATLPVGVNPWETTEIAISSIDLVKRGDVRGALDAVPFDLLIVDEAHHLSPGTERGALVMSLASRIPWVVLATATPHTGDDRAYAFLQNMGAHPNGPDLLVFRRSAQQAGRRRTRRSQFRAVTPSPRERHLLDETYAYAREIWRHAGDGPYGAIVASVTCKRAVSCPAALARTLERRHQLLRGGDASDTSQPVLPWLEDENADDCEPDAVLGSPGLTDRARELAWIERMVTLARALEGRSSKFDAVERLLARSSEPAIVFSEYRDSIAALAARLGRRLAVALLHGGMSPRERRESIERFVRGRARVLLATDAAGEGLNLQERCRLVIDLELPWSPARLEQRVGRVDRLGQRRRVHARHLFYRDTFEEHVRTRLLSRLDAVPAVAHDLTDSAIAGVVARLSLTRTALCLAASGGQRRHDGRPVCASSPRRRDRTATILLLFEADVHDRSGRLIARELVAVRVTCDRSFRSDDRHAISRLAQSGRILGIVTATLARCLAAAHTDASRTSSALGARLAGILTSQTPYRPTLFQGSLFDRRAERAAGATQAAAQKLRQHVEARRETFDALADVKVSAPRLIAAWPLLDERERVEGLTPVEG
jgi:superfamily II DNA or RNA helicase